MSIIVENGKFRQSSQRNEQDFVPVAQDGAIAAAVVSVDLKSDTSPEMLDLIPDTVRLIRIEFPSSADGRGLSLARALRDRGFKGHLRAFGSILSDQYPLALRSGFDDVEISEELAARQPEEQWAESLIRINETYQSRLLGTQHRTMEAA